MRDALTATCRPWRVRDVAKRGSRFVLHVRPRECTASGPAALRERQRSGGRGLQQVPVFCDVFLGIEKSGFSASPLLSDVPLCPGKAL